MDSPRITLARVVDVREGEWKAAILSFALLLLASGAYTVLETARDALLVMHLPKHDFGLAYIAVAVFALPVAGLMTRLGRYLDARRVLLSVLTMSVIAALAWYTVPLTRMSVVAFYVVVGLISSSLFPQFWLLMGGLLTVGQGRRLFGPIGSASVFGSAFGAGFAALVVPALPIQSLPLVAAAMFATAGCVALAVPAPPPKPGTAGRKPVKMATSVGALRAEPLLVRVAVLVVLTTATALVVDYFFKWTIARSVPSDERGIYVARYYALVNAAALVVQLFLGTALVRKLGVATALEITPLVSVFGGGAALLGGAAILPVLLLKAADASLRSSINRLTTELVYLPVSPVSRERAKPFIDGALMRIAQATTAGILLVLANFHLLSPRLFSGMIVLFACAWLVASFTMRSAYLGQLRSSVTGGGSRDPTDAAPLDVAGAELLVEYLGSDDPVMVFASMDILARRGHHRFIPALILRHPDPKVLVRAFEIFGRNPPGGWYHLATELLAHASDEVRLAAARALAMHDKLDARKLDADLAPSVRGYASVLRALRDGTGDIATDPTIAGLLANEGAGATRLGILTAVADVPPSGRVYSLLAILSGPDEEGSKTWTDLLARAAVRHHDLGIIPRLIARLSRSAGRESILEALVSLGEPALEAVARAFEDESVDREIRVHLPIALARFGTKWAAEKLLDGLEREKDGRVRYKILQALGRLIAEKGIRVDRVRVERIARATLAAHFQLESLRVALGGPPSPGREQQVKTHFLLAGLLDDKLRQSLERAFRLLKIAHPKEDIHRVYLACLSQDRRARANASEFLDALLRRRDQQTLRELVRLVSDDLPPREQVARAAELLGFHPPQTREDAVRAGVGDPDLKLATLAALYAEAMGDEWLPKALNLRPALATTASDLFQEALLQLRTSSA